MSQRRAKRARRDQQAHDRPPARARRTWPAHPAAIVLAAVVVVALVAGFFAARGNGPASATRVRSHGNGVFALGGSDPVTGRHVELASYRGKPIVLNVWGSWCEGCNAEAADLARFERAHPEVQVIGVDTQDTSAGAKTFYRRWGWRHPSIADPNGELAARLRIQGTPTTFFLNRRHEPVAQIVGATDEAGFERGLEQAVAAS